MIPFWEYDISDLIELNNWKRIGISSLGDRLKILKAAKTANSTGNLLDPAAFIQLEDIKILKKLRFIDSTFVLTVSSSGAFGAVYKVENFQKFITNV